MRIHQHHDHKQRKDYYINPLFSDVLKPKRLPKSADSFIEQHTILSSQRGSIENQTLVLNLNVTSKPKITVPLRTDNVHFMSTCHLRSFIVKG